MRVWTVHAWPEARGPAGLAAPGAEPVRLVREGFAWAAFLFGGFWLLAHRLWLAALVWLALVVGMALLLPARISGPASLGLAILVGAHGRDLERRRLGRLGYRETGVVAAHDLDGALARLLAEQPVLAAPMARAALA